jgi:circadian clock protein KaiB
MTIRKELENALKKRKSRKYVLHLYVAGLSPRSQRAIDNIKKICDKHLQGGYELEIQDIYKNPIIAKNGQILGAPTLVKELPPPLRKFIGDLSDTEKLLVGLDLKSKSK